MQRLTLPVLLLLVLAIALPSGAGTQDDEIQALKRQVELLELELRALEAQVKALELRLRAVSLGSGPGPAEVRPAPAWAMPAPAPQAAAPQPGAAPGAPPSPVAPAPVTPPALAGVAAPGAYQQPPLVEGQKPARAAPLEAPATPRPGSVLAAPAVAQTSPGEAEAQRLLKEIPDLADRGEIERARERLAEFKEKYLATKVGGQAAYFSRELDVIGKAAPADWSIEKWLQGQGEIDFSGRKTTLVIFWEEWCPHCKDEMPKMQALYDAHKAVGLQVLGVTRLTQTSTEEKVRAFVASNGIKFPIAKENGGLTSHFNVGGIPAAAIVKAGTVVWRGHPLRMTEQTLKHWL